MTEGAELVCIMGAQVTLTIFTCVATLFAYRADKNTRWLQGIMLPWMVSVSRRLDVTPPRER